MSEELLINVSPQEIRIARVENGVLVEVQIERVTSRGLIGNIYQGKVVRVLPGMEAAFVEVGLQKAAFLHVGDLASAHYIDSDGVARTRNIADCLREGQELLVQVIKDQLGSKGARISTRLSIPSRYLVKMPYDNTIGVSAKLESDEERTRLKTAVETLIADNESANPDHGYIVRTAAEGVKHEDIGLDYAFLQRLWNKIQRRESEAAPGALVYEDLPIIKRTLRDLAAAPIDRIRVDSREWFSKANEFASEFLPQLASKIQLYTGERPIFELFGVEDDISRALERRVDLKSGGYLVVDQTESMTTIDVNTGGFVGHRNLEETIFKTNLEAAQAIARQLRLRNLGGIIIIDFIDMSEPEHWRQVMRAFHKALERDSARIYVSEASELGLVEMTRKRTRDSLERQLCETCPTCAGTGRIRTVETVGYDIAREIVRQVRQFEPSQLTVLASPAVVELMMGDLSAYYAELEEFVGVPVRLVPESMYSQEHYDVVLN
ncbi:MAG: ribonuclease G [Gammaproteobacteria bacterium]|nr:ribonuclease G [Gammaproteobacteria bacterium]